MQSVAFKKKSFTIFYKEILASLITNEIALAAQTTVFSDK